MPAGGEAEPAQGGDDAAQDAYPAGYRLGVVLLEAEFTAAWTQEQMSAWNVLFYGGERNIVLELQQDVGAIAQLHITLGSCADIKPVPSTNWTTHFLCERPMGTESTQLQIQVAVPGAPVATGRFVLRADVPLKDVWDSDGDGKPDDFHYEGSVDLLHRGETIDFEFGIPMQWKSAHVRAWLEGSHGSPVTVVGEVCWLLEMQSYSGFEYGKQSGGECSDQPSWQGYQLGPHDVVDYGGPLCICLYRLTLEAQQQSNELHWDIRVEY
ncbi:MAG: hypothetical protein AABY18_00015 [Candidatus Thermoplasmatota archaeon]